jgi:drug/metabolite transporter (DMT)-like permease
MAIVGAVAFSGKAIIAKLIYLHGTDTVTLVMLRMVFALPIFAIMGLWASRGKPPLTARQWGGVLFLGTTGYYLSSVLDFAGLQYITASLERLILYLNPTLVMVLGWLLYRKRILGGHWLGMITSYLGVMLVFGHEVGVQGPQAALGSALVFASAISYATYLVYSARMVRALGAVRLVGWATTVACILGIVQFILLRPLDGLAQIPPEVVGLSVLNATVCTAVPVLLVMMAVERIGAAATAQAGMVGPLATIALGAWLLGEPLNAFVGLGTVLVLMGIWLFSRVRV